MWPTQLRSRHDLTISMVRQQLALLMTLILSKNTKKQVTEPLLPTSRSGIEIYSRQSAPEKNCSVVVGITG